MIWFRKFIVIIYVILKHFYVGELSARIRVLDTIISICNVPRGLSLNPVSVYNLLLAVGYNLPPPGGQDQPNIDHRLNVLAHLNT